MKMKMSHCTMFNILVVQILLALHRDVVVMATLSSDIYHSEYEGISAFLSVDSRKVQAKLDEYAQSHPEAPRLYLPSYEVFPGLEDGKHVVNIDFGVSNLFEFADAYPYEGSVLIYLPFLSTSPGGPAIYSLMISKKLPESLKGITELSELSAHPEISLTEETDGADDLRVTFDVPSNCDDSSGLNRVFHEVDDKVIKSLIFGEDEMLYPYGCRDGKGPDTEAFAEHCAYYEAILPDVLEAAPNVCISTIIKEEKSCQTTFDVTGITQAIREMLFLDDAPITVLGAEKFKGKYATGLKYPCVEF